MKYKIIALILTLATTTWAQTSTPKQSASDQAAPETKCACCDKTASASSEHKHACMHSMSSSKDSKEVTGCCGKNEASCCEGKDGKSCAKMAASAGCCGEKSSAAGAKHGCSNGKSCCANKDGKQTAHNCCGANNQCGHAQPQPAPGN